MDNLHIAARRAAVRNFAARINSTGNTLELAYNRRCRILRNATPRLSFSSDCSHRWFETRSLLVHRPVTSIATRTDNWPKFRWRCSHVMRPLPAIVSPPDYTCSEGTRTVQIVPVNWMEHGTQPAANSRTRLPFVGSMRALSPFIVFFTTDIQICLINY